MKSVNFVLFFILIGASIRQSQFIFLFQIQISSLSLYNLE